MATTKVPNNLINLSGDSGAVPWAAGTTAQRPGSPNAGDFRYNTDDSLSLNFIMARPGDK